ncbi:hypothetical protein BDY24DRAFT_386828 [Mrakia frigida]|uniref:uncharacterized protein n=1 Tax=Mrakia frigida TaxID=29902 RepID=UPI003FCBF844
MAELATTDIATRGARDFVRIYFSALDSDEASLILPRLHRPTSLTSWNGTPLSPDLLPDFFSKLPSSRHEVQSIDVHPVLGTTPAPLQVIASGLVLHFSPLPPTPTDTPETIAASSKIPPQSVTEYRKNKHPDDMQKMPRMFHATFLLLPVGGAEGAEDGGVKYYVASTMYRFVG